MDQSTIDALTLAVSAPLVAGSAAVLGLLAKEWATTRWGPAPEPRQVPPRAPVVAPVEQRPVEREEVVSEPAAVVVEPELGSVEPSVELDDSPVEQGEPRIYPPVQPVPPPPAVGSGVQVADLAVELWRMHRRWSRTNLAEAPGGRQIADSLRRIDDALVAQRVETRVHDGDRYRDGSRLRVSHVDGDDTDIDAHTVLAVTETIEPTVLVDGVMVRPGLVVLSKVVSGAGREGRQ